MVTPKSSYLYDFEIRLFYNKFIPVEEISDVPWSLDQMYHNSHFPCLSEVSCESYHCFCDYVPLEPISEVSINPSFWLDSIPLQSDTWPCQCINGSQSQKSCKNCKNFWRRICTPSSCQLRTVLALAHASLQKKKKTQALAQTISCVWTYWLTGCVCLAIRERSILSFSNRTPGEDIWCPSAYLSSPHPLPLNSHTLNNK